MDRPTADELRRLADDFGVGLPDAQTDEVTETVGDFLEPLDEVDDLPLVSSADDAAPRTWEETNDPHNAVVHRCHVPPSGDGPLDGYDVGLKDNVAVAGVPLGAGTDVLRGVFPRSDAAVARRLRAAGATLAAKLACDEFAGSARGTTGAHGPVRNPHDADRTAGGSSGGSAVAVATGDVDVAIGSDTGGSIRMPAAFCGVVGLKPTYGLVPLSGVVENTYTQDHLGPLASSVADAARTLDAIAGKDPDDPGSMAAAGLDDYRAGGYADAVADAPDPADLSVGVLEEGFGDDVRDAVEERTRAATDRLADAGATVRSVSVDHWDAVGTVKNLLSLSELAAHWRAGGAPYRRGGVVDEGLQSALAARTATRGDELGPYYRSKLLAGAALLERGGRRYTRAQHAREALADAFDEALADVDVLLTPTMPDVAPRIEDATDPDFPYSRNTRPADVTRQPAISLPNGTVKGLPVGLQLQAGHFEERSLVATAATVADVATGD